MYDDDTMTRGCCWRAVSGVDSGVVVGVDESSLCKSMGLCYEWEKRGRGDSGSALVDRGCHQQHNSNDDVHIGYTRLLNIPCSASAAHIKPNGRRLPEPSGNSLEDAYESPYGHNRKHA